MNKGIAQNWALEVDQEQAPWGSVNVHSVSRIPESHLIELMICLLPLTRTKGCSRLSLEEAYNFGGVRLNARMEGTAN